MVKDKLFEKAVWTIRKFHGDRDVYDAWMRGEEGNEPFEVVEIEGIYSRLAFHYIYQLPLKSAIQQFTSAADAEQRRQNDVLTMIR